MTPALLFWFIVVSSGFHLFPFLDRSSPIPTMPTKFHPHLQAWIHSTPVSPSSRPLSFNFGGAMHHGFHPKHPFKLLKSKLSRTDRQTFRPKFRWESLIHIWISPRHWKDASGKKRSLESDTPTQTFFSTVPLLTFLALAFTVLTLLLLCNLNFTSSMHLSWLFFGYQTGL